MQPMKQRKPQAQPTTRDAVVALAKRVRREQVEIIEAWEERAAIREYDGNQWRAAAEADALSDVRRMFEPQGRIL